MSFGATFLYRFYDHWSKQTTIRELNLDTQWVRQSSLCRWIAMSPFRVLMVRPLSTSWWRFIHCVCGEVALASLTAEGQSIQGGELYMALWSGGGEFGEKKPMRKHKTHSLKHSRNDSKREKWNPWTFGKIKPANIYSLIWFCMCVSDLCVRTDYWCAK